MSSAERIKLGHVTGLRRVESESPEGDRQLRRARRLRDKRAWDERSWRRDWNRELAVARIFGGAS